MAWYDAGTVNVTLNSATVTGVGTQWVAGARQGEAFVGPDGRLYEVLNIASNTSLTLTRPYRGATQAAQPYALAPFQGYVKELADRAAALLNSMQTDYATVLRQADLQDPAGAPVSGKILRTDTFGLGNRLRAWVAGVTSAEPLWVKIATVTGQANQRAMFQFAGAAFGYGSANGATTGFAVLSATMGNAAQENNLNLEFLYATPENQCAIYGLKTVRISNTKFEIWVRARAHSKLMVSYGGDMQLVEPHWAGNTQAAAPDPAFHWEAWMHPIWTGRNLPLVGDVAAGALMQSGTNTNGSWFRFQGGLQICWGRKSFPGGTWKPASAYQQFPIAFKSGTIPNLQYTTGTDGTGYTSVVQVAEGLTELNYRIRQSTGAVDSGSSVDLLFNATGFWK